MNPIGAAFAVLSASWAARYFFGNALRPHPIEGLSKLDRLLHFIAGLIFSAVVIGIVAIVFLER